MKTFDYRHAPALGQEFVNGGYELGEVKHLMVDGRDILYRVGSALLDNSCCGNFGCGFGLVIGEHVEQLEGGPLPLSRVRAIAPDDADAERIRNALIAHEAVNVVNFYTVPGEA